VPRDVQEYIMEMKSLWKELIATTGLAVTSAIAMADPATQHGPAVATQGTETVTVDYAVHVGDNIFVSYAKHHADQDNTVQSRVFLDCAHGTYTHAVDEHTPGDTWEHVAGAGWELKAVADSVCKAVRTAQARWVLRRPDGTLDGPSRGFDTKEDCESFQQQLRVPGECRTDN
jgi:hypothetical protein